MLLLAKYLTRKDEDFGSTLMFFASAMIDKVLFFIGGMYLFYWLGSLFSASFDYTYGDFFLNIGMLLFVYGATVISSWLSKIVSATIFTPIGFAFLTYLLAFPTIGSSLSFILALVIGVFCVLSKPDVKMITWTLVGYWLLLFFVSAGDYSLFGAMSEGIVATFVEVWTIAWNAAGYTVYNQALSGIGGIAVLVFGIFVTRLLNGQLKLPSYEKGKEDVKIQTKEEIEEMAKSKQEVKLKNDRVFNETIDERVQQRLQSKEIADYQVKAEVEETKPNSANEVVLKETEPQEKKTELSSKAFFNIQTPTVKIKLNKLLEEGLRRIAK